MSTIYHYSTSTTDPDGDNVRYKFSWGDGSTTTTGWIPSGYTASASHSWSSPGTYEVKVKAKDEYEAWSGWSPPLMVTVKKPTLTISAGSGGTTDPAPGSYTYEWGTEVEVTASSDSGYVFNYWILDGATKYGNPITVTMDSNHDLEAYFGTPVNLEVTVPQAPSEGVKVWVDDNEYTAYADAPATVTVGAGEHTVEVEQSFLKEQWKPGTYYIYTFNHWTDGSTANPRTIHLTSDTTLTAYYTRSKYGIQTQSEEPQSN